MFLKPSTPRKAVGTWAVNDNVAVTVLLLLVTEELWMVGDGDAGALEVKMSCR